MKPRLWGSAKIILAVSILCLYVLAGAGLAGTTEPLPAQQWNQENLSKITGLNAEPLTFAVLGDNRDDPEVFGKVLRQMDLDPSLNFAIHLGDMVKNADVAQYCIFFEKVRRYYPKPLVTVIGNHELYGERGLKLYHDLFGQDYYSFQVGSNYFIMVDDAAKEVWTPEQFRWLEGELQKSQAYKTRLVFLHVPLFDPSGSPKPHSLPPEAASQLLSLFKKYKVNHVFAAHIHGYYAGHWEGLPYTITGGAGAPLYGTDPRHVFYHYLKVTIAGGQVQVQVRPLANNGGQ